MPEGEVMRLGRFITGLLAVAPMISMGCGSNPAQSKSFAVTLDATNDDAESLKGVKFTAGSTYIGTTDERGRLSVSLRGSEGQTVPLAVVCPDGYDAPEEAPKLRLAEIRRVGQAEAAGIHLGTVCTRSLRDIVVVVRTTGATSMPIDIGGKSAGETDLNGIAHLRLSLDRDVRSLSVSLGTNGFPQLRPQNPSRVFELDGSDAILLVDQSFSTEKRPQVRRASAVATPPVRKRVPQRIDSARFHAL